MVPSRFGIATCLALLSACGGSTSTGSADASGDGTITDVRSQDTTTPGDASGEGAADAPADAGGDGGAPGDSSDDGVILADGACGCAPYWCGCGACNPGDIACTVNPPPCGLGCASACPELQQTTCACQNDRCIRGGIDAGAVGCLADHDCPLGDCCAFIQGKGHCTPVGSTCCVTPCP
jgi:hypothetical protein